MQAAVQPPVREPRGSPFQVRLTWLEDAPTITINTDAATARRRVSTWLFDHVATMLMGDVPQLALEQDSNQLRAVWRVPVVLTSQRGILGKVGEVVVNANTGEPSTSTNLADSLIAQAQSLLTANVSPARPSSPPA